MSDTSPPPPGGPGPNTPPYGGASGYGAPPPGPAYGGGPVGQPPPNHLAWAILTTILCCLPLGVVSIVFAAQVDGKWGAGDVAGAQAASRKARTFALWGTILGALGMILRIAVVALGSTTTGGTGDL